MSAMEAAGLFRLWAVSQGLIQRDHIAAVVADEAARADFAALGAIRPAAVGILHSRAISFIGYDEPRNAVVVFTHKKLTKKEIAQLPSETENGSLIEYRQGAHGAVGGPPTASVGVPPYALHAARYTCGSSIHPANVVDAGTLGCLVRDATGTMFGLTNNHVSGGCNFSYPGLPILAPGPVDVGPNGVDPFTIGYHAKLLPMVDGLPQNVNVADNSDAALLQIKDPGQVSSMQRGYFDTPAKTAQITVGDVVRKVGRTTGLTQGIVRAAVYGPEMIRYRVSAAGGALKLVFLSNLLVVEGEGGLFASGGDSGSLVTVELAGGERRAVGLVVAVNDANGICFVLPIEPILQAFEVNLVSGHNI